MEACVDRLKQYFTDQHVYFEVQEQRQVYTMQEVASVLHEKGEHVAKVFIATVDGKPAMLVLPAHGAGGSRSGARTAEGHRGPPRPRVRICAAVRRLRCRRDAALWQHALFWRAPGKDGHSPAAPQDPCRRQSLPRVGLGLSDLDDAIGRAAVAQGCVVKPASGAAWPAWKEGAEWKPLRDAMTAALESTMLWR